MIDQLDREVPGSAPTTARVSSVELLSTTMTSHASSDGQGRQARERRREDPSARLNVGITMENIIGRRRLRKEFQKKENGFPAYRVSMQPERHVSAAQESHPLAVRRLNRLRSMPHPRTAIILAAGSGSRLLPHTAHAPKCLTPIAGQPILRYQIAALRHCGITDIVIVVGYKGDRIREFVDSSVTLVDNREFAITNSSYSLWLAREHMSDGFIHLNSDLLFEPADAARASDAHAENAIVVDRQVRAGSDMMKARMQGREDSGDGQGAHGRCRGGSDWSGEVRSVRAPSLMLRRLSELAAESDRNRWAYSVFGELAPEMQFVGCR